MGRIENCSRWQNIRSDLGGIGRESFDMRETSCLRIKSQVGYGPRIAGLWLRDIDNKQENPFHNFGPGE